MFEEFASSSSPPLLLPVPVFPESHASLHEPEEARGRKRARGLDYVPNMHERIRYNGKDYTPFYGDDIPPPTTNPKSGKHKEWVMHKLGLEDMRSQYKNQKNARKEAAKATLFTSSSREGVSTTHVITTPYALPKSKSKSKSKMQPPPPSPPPSFSRSGSSGSTPPPPPPSSQPPSSHATSPPQKIRLHVAHFPDTEPRWVWFFDYDSVPFTTTPSGPPSAVMVPPDDGRDLTDLAGVVKRMGDTLATLFAERIGFTPTTLVDDLGVVNNMIVRRTERRTERQTLSPTDNIYARATRQDYAYAREVAEEEVPFLAEMDQVGSLVQVVDLKAWRAPHPVDFVCVRVIPLEPHSVFRSSVISDHSVLVALVGDVVVEVDVFPGDTIRDGGTVYLTPHCSRRVGLYLGPETKPEIISFLDSAQWALRVGTVRLPESEPRPGLPPTSNRRMVLATVASTTQAFLPAFKATLKEYRANRANTTGAVPADRVPIIRPHSLLDRTAELAAALCGARGQNPQIVVVSGPPPVTETSSTAASIVQKAMRSQGTAAFERRYPDGLLWVTADEVTRAKDNPRIASTLFPLIDGFRLFPDRAFLIVVDGIEDKHHAVVEVLDAMAVFASSSSVVLVTTEFKALASSLKDRALEFEHVALSEWDLVPFRHNSDVMNALMDSRMLEKMLPVDLCGHLLPPLACGEFDVVDAYLSLLFDSSCVRNNRDATLDAFLFLCAHLTRRAGMTMGYFLHPTMHPVGHFESSRCILERDRLWDSGCVDALDDLVRAGFLHWSGCRWSGDWRMEPVVLVAVMSLLREFPPWHDQPETMARWRGEEEQVDGEEGLPLFGEWRGEVARVRTSWLRVLNILVVDWIRGEEAMLYASPPGSFWIPQIDREWVFGDLMFMVRNGQGGLSNSGRVDFLPPWVAMLEAGVPIESLALVGKDSYVGCCVLFQLGYGGLNKWVEDVEAVEEWVASRACDGDGDGATSVLAPVLRLKDVVTAPWPLGEDPFLEYREPGFWGVNRGKEERRKAFFAGAVPSLMAACFDYLPSPLASPFGAPPLALLRLSNVAVDVDRLERNRGMKGPEYDAFVPKLHKVWNGESFGVDELLDVRSLGEGAAVAVCRMFPDDCVAVIWVVPGVFTPHVVWLEAERGGEHQLADCKIVEVEFRGGEVSVVVDTWWCVDGHDTDWEQMDGLREGAFLEVIRVFRPFGDGGSDEDEDEDDLWIEYLWAVRVSSDWTTMVEVEVAFGLEMEGEVEGEVVEGEQGLRGLRGVRGLRRVALSQFGAVLVHVGEGTRAAGIGTARGTAWSGRFSGVAEMVEKGMIKTMVPFAYEGGDGSGSGLGESGSGESTPRESVLVAVWTDEKKLNTGVTVLFPSTGDVVDVLFEFECEFGSDSDLRQALEALRLNARSVVTMSGNSWKRSLATLAHGEGGGVVRLLVTGMQCFVVAEWKVVDVVREAWESRTRGVSRMMHSSAYDFLYDPGKVAALVGDEAVVFGSGRVGSISTHISSREVVRYREGETRLGVRREDAWWATRGMGMYWEEKDVLFFEDRPWVPLRRNGRVLGWGRLAVTRDEIVESSFVVSGNSFPRRAPSLTPPSNVCLGGVVVRWVSKPGVGSGSE